MTLLVFLGWLIDSVVGALIRADDVGARFSVAILDEMRLQWPLGLAVGASVIITVFSAKQVGLGVLAVFIGPLLVTQIAFRRYAGIRATYLQTVRSLARVTEVAGYVEAGHSRRVSRLAVSVGRGLGMPEPELLALEYAALMHDIGQLSLTRADPGRRHRPGLGRRSGPDRRAGQRGHPGSGRAGRRRRPGPLPELAGPRARSGAAARQHDHQGR